MNDPRKIGGESRVRTDRGGMTIICGAGHVERVRSTPNWPLPVQASGMNGQEDDRTARPAARVNRPGIDQPVAAHRASLGETDEAKGGNVRVAEMVKLFGGNVVSTIPTHAVASNERSTRSDVAAARRGNFSRGPHRVASSTNAKRRHKSADSTQTTVLQLKVILRSLPDSMAKKTRLCLLPKESNNDPERTTAAKSTAGAGEGSSLRKSTLCDTNVSNGYATRRRQGVLPPTPKDTSQDAATAANNTSNLTGALAEANGLKIGSLAVTREPTAEYTEALSAHRQPTPSTDAEMTDREDTTQDGSATQNIDVSETCSRCKTVGCRKMNEYERQRLAQMKRQRLVKTTAAGGKRRYQQRKTKAK